ncbi:hypothetical protein SAMN05444000_107132 [Shimia gijangensis]|uniref:Uncharacterized protein n=1 Tax=Shimia gijangensis TaxID=1470563 RepID=A0A1M6IIF9_9RHOB|nr:hypothetical protein SAMN05444000_107132 [Shimia gijangensis]
MGRPFCTKRVFCQKSLYKTDKAALLARLLQFSILCDRSEVFGLRHAQNVIATIDADDLTRGKTPGI